MFKMKWTEKGAIQGHSVDRYQYALQLIREDTNESLIKAYVWLSLAADEVDMRENAGILKHQVGFELRKRCIFENAQMLERSYRERYSAEALAKKLMKVGSLFMLCYV